jgi:hypothetical protein
MISATIDDNARAFVRRDGKLVFVTRNPAVLNRIRKNWWQSDGCCLDEVERRRRWRPCTVLPHP